MKKFSLDDIPKQEPFKAPAGYFEDLPMRVQKRIEGSRPEKGRVPHPVFKWSLASLVILITVAGVVVWTDRRDTGADPLDGVATADLVYFLEVEYVGADELIDAFDSFSPGDSLWSEYESEAIPAEDLTEEEIMQLYEQFESTGEIL